MDDDLLDEPIFTPNPLLVADLIFESPKPPKHAVIAQRRGSELAMNYNHHPAPVEMGQQPQVHFEDGKTTKLTPHQAPAPQGIPQQYPQLPQAAYPLQQQQQASFQPQPYFPPPPNQPEGVTAPIPIPRSRGNSNSTQRSVSSHPNPSYPPPNAYNGNANGPGPMPPQAAYGSWPQHGFYPPPGALSHTDLRRQSGPPGAPPPSMLSLPGPQGYYPAPPLPPAPGTGAMKPRTGSSSSYASHHSRSSHRLRDDSPERDRGMYGESPLYETDEESTDDSDDGRRRHHHRHHHSSSSSSHHGHSHHHHHRRSKDGDRQSVRHGDRSDRKYSNHSDHASLADTLVLIWDGLSGGLGKPKRR